MQFETDPFTSLTDDLAHDRRLIRSFDPGMLRRLWKSCRAGLKAGKFEAENAIMIGAIELELANRSD